MELWTRNAADMYSSMMVLMTGEGVPEPSRNGTVMTIQRPVMVNVSRPTQRVVLDPIRNCNPFFHLAEVVWMMAGDSHVGWLKQFNKRFEEYADEDGTVHGAYGDRWRHWFERDQILGAVRLLQQDFESRRVVLGMWDPENDLGAEYNDIPCNTHIYLRVVDNLLQMTVCNRSNDVIWGMCGANIVHMTCLQELIASELGLEPGLYTVMTNNAHVYRDLPGVWSMLNTKSPVECSSSTYMPLLTGTTLEQFRDDCCNISTERYGDVASPWLAKVVVPMLECYQSGTKIPPNVLCPQWQEAASTWLLRNRG